MPGEYKNHYMTVLCNDCLHKSEVKFHIVGGKCEKCKSYNTTQLGGLVEKSPKRNLKKQNRYRKLEKTKMSGRMLAVLMAKKRSAKSEI